jgi:two-component system sensor histidine kinase KdpD
LEGTRVLSSLAFSLALLPGSNKSCWQVAASTTTRHPVGKQITEPKWEQIDRPIFYAGAGQSLALPEFIVDDNVDQLVCARLSTPGGDTLGMIVVGRQTDHPMSDDEQAFLRTLAVEAGLALRNAQLYAREQEQVARLRRFEELQSIFFSAIGHELKTPLTVLKTLAPSLRQLPELPVDTQAEITETIEQNLARLELLINDLLESSRLEAEAVALHTRSINLVNRVQRVLDSWAPLLDRKRQQVSLKAESDLPMVQAEGRRVEQILSNLMNNAAKFAPPDSTIEVELGSVDDVVQVCVVDAGPGVPPEEQARVFDKFYIAAKDKALAGAGLGLFICRELVRLHGGRIWIEDRPGGGSRFCFTLPRADKVTSDEENRP